MLHDVLGIDAVQNPEAGGGAARGPAGAGGRSLDPKSGREDSVQIRKKIPETFRDVRIHYMNRVEQGTLTGTAN